MTEPIVLDLDDPYFDGQSLPDALADYTHVHSTTGVCVKHPTGSHCDETDAAFARLVAIQNGGAA